MRGTSGAKATIWKPGAVPVAVTWTPALDRVKESAAAPTTSPRLRGEVGIRALARGSRVRGKGACCNGGRLYNCKQAPHPSPPPPPPGEGESCGSDERQMRRTAKPIGARRPIRQG